jgi:hypothetical protein
MRWDAGSAEAVIAIEALTQRASGTCIGKLNYRQRFSMPGTLARPSLMLKPTA